MQLVGLGTLVNVATVLAGGGLGLAVGSRLSRRTADTVTDVLGLVTLVIGGLSIAPLGSAALQATVPHGAAMVVILLALVLGALAGSALRIEDRLDDLGEWAKQRLSPASEGSHFVNGFVTTTMLFCVGPMTILGSLSDGLGRGSEQLLIKSVLDGFSAMAFASSLGVGVLLSSVSVLVVQGSLTLVGALLGSVVPPAEIDALTVAGGIILLGLGIRLLAIKSVRVADLLPALLLAPLLVSCCRLF